MLSAWGFSLHVAASTNRTSVLTPCALIVLQGTGKPLDHLRLLIDALQHESLAVRYSTLGQLKTFMRKWVRATAASAHYDVRIPSETCSPSKCSNAWVGSAPTCVLCACTPFVNVYCALALGMLPVCCPAPSTGLRGVRGDHVTSALCYRHVCWHVSMGTDPVLAAALITSSCLCPSRPALAALAGSPGAGDLCLCRTQRHICGLLRAGTRSGWASC